MAELNFNADAPFPPAHIAPGSALDKFRTMQANPELTPQSNLTAQADAEPVMTPQAAPDKPFTFWPEDLKVVTAADIVVPEVAEPVINPELKAESQTLIETPAQPETQIVPMARLSMPWEAGPQFENPVEPAAKSNGRKKDPVKAAAKEHVKSLYDAYMNLCARRKVVLKQWDEDIRAAYNRFMDAKKEL